MERTKPETVVKKIFEEKYPGSNCIFLAGSVLRNEATKYSDLDIVVLYDHLDNAFRESFIFFDWPVEAFVHDLSTLKYFFEDDKKHGKPSLASMVSEGVVVEQITDLSIAAKTLAGEILKQGPGKLDKTTIDNYRYSITDLVDDIRDPRSRDEAVATGTQLYSKLSDFYLRANNHWSADGKTIPRVLKKLDGHFYKTFQMAFDNLFSKGQHEELVKLAQFLLEPYGGFLFDGVKLEAPKEWRS